MLFSILNHNKLFFKFDFFENNTSAKKSKFSGGGGDEPEPGEPEPA